jgi:hypothetical protein
LPAHETAKLTHYRILKSVDEGGASGAGRTLEDVCVQSAFHATIYRDSWDGKLIEVKNAGPCTCVDHPVFPELLAAIGYDRG